MKKLTNCPGHALAAALISSYLLVVIGCQKQPPTNPEPPAQGYFLSDKAGHCSATNIHGKWYNGLPANTDTNYVEVSVYVTRPGPYTITSDTVNGVKFTGTGNFPDTGMAVARLKGTGSFRTPGNYATQIHFDSTDCQFGFPVNDSAGLTIGGNMWTFTAEGHTYSGPCSLQVFDMPESPIWHFDLEGTVSGSADTAFLISLDYSNSLTPLDPGHYLTTEDHGLFQLYVTGPNGGVVKSLYYASYNAPPSAIDVNVLSRVENGEPYHVVWVATFNGTAFSFDSNGNTVPVTKAKFKIGTP